MLPSMFRPDLFAGKVVLITGGGTGLGQAIALRLGALGAKVAVCGRRLDPLLCCCRGIRLRCGPQR
jgi:NAD(P)-dependent dehydrogenase (short-subunit alcohol dehydrogenase family)